MSHPPMDNGDAFMRAYREALRQAQAQVISQYNRYPLSQLAIYSNLNTRHDPPIAGTPGEREAEDVTGLRLLEEFLAKRKGERDGDERK